MYSLEILDNSAVNTIIPPAHLNHWFIRRDSLYTMRVLHCNMNNGHRNRALYCFHSVTVNTQTEAVSLLSQSVRG